MGSSTAGLIIKIDTEKINLNTIARDIFGKKYKKKKKYCDTRYKGCVYIAKTKNELVILNSNLAEKFFTGRKNSKANSVLDYFEGSKFIMAFEEYDGGDTFSYSLIYDGVTKRTFRSLSGVTTIDTGTLERNETLWKGADRYIADFGYGDEGVVCRDPEGKQDCDENQLPQRILSEIMFEKFGFSMWSLYDIQIEECNYGTKTKEEKLQTEVRVKLSVFFLSLVIIALGLSWYFVIQSSNNKKLDLEGIRTEATIVDLSKSLPITRTQYFLTVEYIDNKKEKHIVEIQIKSEVFYRNHLGKKISILYLESNPQIIKLTSKVD